MVERKLVPSIAVLFGLFLFATLFDWWFQTQEAIPPSAIDLLVFGGITVILGVLFLLVTLGRSRV